ncbi:MAG: hypothetical protein QM820_02680 [Minicystis sp.]
MYQPEEYLTIEVLSEVVSQLDWPAPYTLEDELPDGISMIFPKCTLFFGEGFESEMYLKFIPEDTGLDNAVTLKEVLVALGGRPTPQLKLVDDGSSGASVATVKNGIRKLCTILLAHFRETLLGDFWWVEPYKAHRTAELKRAGR